MRGEPIAAVGLLLGHMVCRPKPRSSHCALGTETGRVIDCHSILSRLHQDRSGWDEMKEGLTLSMMPGCLAQGNAIASSRLPASTPTFHHPSCDRCVMALDWVLASMLDRISGLFNLYGPCKQICLFGKPKVLITQAPLDITLSKVAAWHNESFVQTSRRSCEETGRTCRRWSQPCHRAA